MLLIKENEQKTFRFNIEVTGTELRHTSARLVFEDASTNKFFPMEVKNDGTCEYRLEYDEVKNLSKGRVYLEVVAESILFKPWQEEFRVDAVHTVVTENADLIRRTLQAAKSTSGKKAKKTSKYTQMRESAKPATPSYDELLSEFKKLMIKKRVSFTMGESTENRAKKKEAIGELYVKYGSAVKPTLEQLTRTSIEELLIL
jgi:hypothetical protein